MIDTAKTRFLVITLSLFGVSGCSAYIDDFHVDETWDAAADGGIDDVSGTTQSTNGSSPSNTDQIPTTNDTSTPQQGVTCGKMIAPPSGAELEFCTVPAGSFFMGCDESAESGCIADELPQHEVALSAHLIQRHEVTVADFAAFVGAVPEWVKDSTEATLKCGSSYLPGWTGPAPKGGMDNLPVIGVCWHAANAYCQWLGAQFRLPTEAEWEQAARGGHDGITGGNYWMYPFNGTPNCEKANYQSCANDVIPVGMKSGVSSSAIFDMAGNAWEWVSDWYRNTYYCDPLAQGGYASPNCNTAHVWQDPQGDVDGTQKVLRGGSWHHTIDMARSAKRDYLEPNISSNLAGFRCASD